MEARAHAELGTKNGLHLLMQSQHTKGRREYHHPIDGWQADRPTRVCETGREHVDLITYLVALNAPRPVFWCLRPVSWWLERQIRKEVE